MTKVIDTATLALSCDAYRLARTSTFEQRSQRYHSAWELMEVSASGLDDHDILLDYGAGDTDLAVFLHQRGWHGRYWPVDGWMGLDLIWWKPRRPASWIVALEVVEHLPMDIAQQVLREMKSWCTKGIVLTVPNGDVVDVLEIDATHRWSPVAQDFQRLGYATEIRSHFGKVNDSVIAWWYR